MLDLFAIVIDSERLRLIPTSHVYSQEIFTEFTPGITTFMFPKPPDVIDETLEFIRSAREEMNQQSSLQIVVLSKPTGEFLGCGGIHRIDGETPELGIWIKASAHGNKFGREAVAALTGWARANLAFDYLTYPVDRRNFASRQILESLGGLVEAEYEKTNQSGTILDILEYRIYSSETQSQSTGFS